MMRLIKFLPIIIVFGFIVLIISCGDDKSTNPKDQDAIPTIPPQSSLIINIEEFPDTSTLEKINHPNLTKGNWACAAENVKYWNSVLFVTLAIPTAAFVEAFNHQPVKQSDGSWLWNYIVVINSDTYTAKLFGKDLGYGVDWRMLLSKSGSYTDFEWFTGFSNSDATDGSWTVNKNPDLTSPFLAIEWERNIQEETANIKYTIVAPTIPRVGSYISYGKTNEVTLNRYYQILNSDNNNLIDINWNYESKFGQVKDAIYFGDNIYHCWDENLDDSICSE
jgi:hypothetical protein